MESSSSTTTTQSINKNDSWIPEGFVCITGPDNQKYIVPEYLVPDLDQAFHSERKKENLGTLSAKGTVSFVVLA